MNMQVHHIGRVVKNIQSTYEEYKSLGFSVPPAFTEPQIDTYQKVIVGVVKTEPIVTELLMPLDETSPIYNWDTRAGGLHHVCYSTDNIENTIKTIENQKLGRRISEVTTSVWDEKPVVFVLTNEGAIIEYIEL